jgi:hypothetical protein
MVSKYYTHIVHDVFKYNLIYTRFALSCETHAENTEFKRNYYDDFAVPVSELLWLTVNKLTYDYVIYGDKT